MSAFDALDFFHAQQSQQKYQVARLEEAKNALDQLVEADFAQKKRRHGEMVKHKQALASHALLADQVHLLANRAELVCSVETKTLERIAALEHELSETRIANEQETGELLDSCDKLVRDRLADFVKFRRELGQLELELGVVQGRNSLLEEERQATERRLEESNARGRDIRKLVSDVHTHCAELEKERDLVLEQKGRLCHELFVQNRNQHLARGQDLVAQQRDVDLWLAKEIAMQAQSETLIEQTRQVECELRQVLDGQLPLVLAELQQAEHRAPTQEQRFQELQRSLSEKKAQVAGQRQAMQTAGELWEATRPKHDQGFNQLVMDQVEPLKSKVFDLKVKVNALFEANTTRDLALQRTAQQ
ncbi:hypothetical protein BASA81_001529 [Batrachochytrium salamandrivorans]|nr:hypothetical protein BASA81_001529 [Batrachochytrium salamandrivorans]